jgi:hypothetical protein
MLQQVFSCCKLQVASFYLDVAVVIHICCKCMLQIFQLFQTYVASVLFECCICCNGYIHMLQAYVSNVSPVSYVFCSKCFMLQVFLLAGEGSERRWR